MSGTVLFLRGSVDLVSGQDSYSITFPNGGFAGAPATFIPSLAMANDEAEIFALGWDESSLSETGVTVFLFGTPSSLSVGSSINWFAIQ